MKNVQSPTLVTLYGGPRDGEEIELDDVIPDFIEDKHGYYNRSFSRSLELGKIVYLWHRLGLTKPLLKADT